MEYYSQISLFDGKNKFVLDKEIRLIELFAGIGSQAKALERLGVDFTHYRICEFDKYAVASYNAVHGTNFEPSDITKITANDLGIIDTDKYCYIMTYSFPCQDLSNAGLGKGMAKGSGTRSGLLWEVERILDECKELPQVLVMENVPAVISDKNMKDFAKWEEKLGLLGYKNKWEILNAKDFGIPQNRERCFMVSVLGDYYYDFPNTQPLKLKLKDMLEEEVDEKYYLDKIPLKKELCDMLVKNNLVQEFDIIRHSYTYNRLNNGIDNMARKESKDRICCTLDTRCNTLGIAVKKEPIIYDDYNGRIKADQSVIGTLTTNCGNDAERNGVKIIEPKYSDYSIKKIRDNIVKSDIVGTITANVMQSFNPDNCHLVKNNYRIRKLTPKECWLLMGFDSVDVDKAKAVGMSNAQLYKQAGNSIVVNVLVEIFRSML